MGDLFQWAGNANTGADTGAVILPFPVARHASVERMARRLANHDPQRAAFFLRSEVEKIAERRIAAGFPVAIVERQALDFERAVMRRLEAMEHLGGAA